MGCTVSQNRPSQGFIESYTNYYRNYDKSDIDIPKTYPIPESPEVRVDNLSNPRIVYQPTYQKVSREFLDQHIEYLDPYFQENLERYLLEDTLDSSNISNTLDSSNTSEVFEGSQRTEAERIAFNKRCLIEEFETWTKCIFFSQNGDYLIYARGDTLYLYHISSKILKATKWTDKEKDVHCIVADNQGLIVTFEYLDGSKYDPGKGKLAVWNFDLEKQRETVVDLQGCKIWTVWEDYGAVIHQDHLICAHHRLVYAINITTGKLKYYSGNIQNHGCEIAADYIHVFCERFLYPEDFRDRVNFQTDDLVKKHRPYFW